jgi:hypothetical protein
MNISGALPSGNIAQGISASSYDTSVMAGRHTFVCIQAVNGWVLHFDRAQYICKDLNELGQQVVASLVANRLESK